MTYHVKLLIGFQFSALGLHIVLFLLLDLTSTNPASQRIYTMAL